MKQGVGRLGVVMKHAKRARRALCNVKSYNAKPNEDASDLEPQASAATKQEYVNAHGQTELGQRHVETIPEQRNVETPSLHTTPKDVKRTWDEASELEATKEAHMPWSCVWTLEDETQYLQQRQVLPNDACGHLEQPQHDCEAEDARLRHSLAADGLSV